MAGGLEVTLLQDNVGEHFDMNEKDPKSPDCVDRRIGLLTDIYVETVEKTKDGLILIFKETVDMV